LSTRNLTRLLETVREGVRGHAHLPSSHVSAVVKHVKITCGLAASNS